MEFTIPLKAADKVSFFLKFMQSPGQIGSITPSSRFLARRMLAPVDWQQTQAIAELGAGTGAFTKYIVRYKQPDCDVLVFEKDREMRSQLAWKYPELLYWDNAAHLSERARAAGMPALDAIISGLPFALFTPADRESIVNEVIHSLKPGGLFVTFQYSLQMKELLEGRFSRVDISYVPLNLPPAFVYVCYR